MGGNASHTNKNQATFMEHVGEMRGRLMWVCLAVVIGAGIGYSLYHQLLYIIQKPLGQTLYNTTPTGAFSFIIKICVVFGLLVGLPVIMYQIFSFLGPLLSKKSKGMIAAYTFFSVTLAISGALFAYFISLPAALHFLVGFSDGTNIQSIITANEYFNFAFTYILGVAAIFQIPLLFLFINRINPLKPVKLLKGMRYVIVLSFVAAAIITPTPDPFNQVLMALPMILLYMLGIMMVAIVNRKQRYLQPKVTTPVEPTEKVLPQPAPVLQLRPAPAVSPTNVQPVQQHSIKQKPVSPQSPRLISDFVSG